jgi:hypothetical protein
MYQPTRLTDEQIQKLQEAQEARLQTEVMSLQVWDKDYDSVDFEDVGAFDIREDGVLIIADREHQTIALYNHENWAQVMVSRAPRLESTNDESKDDDDAPADL